MGDVLQKYDLVSLSKLGYMFGVLSGPGPLYTSFTLNNDKKDEPVLFKVFLDDSEEGALE